MRPSRNSIRGGALLLALVAGVIAFTGNPDSSGQLVAAVLNIIAISLMGVWFWLRMRDKSRK